MWKEGSDREGMGKGGRKGVRGGKERMRKGEKEVEGNKEGRGSDEKVFESLPSLFNIRNEA